MSCFSAVYFAEAEDANHALLSDVNTLISEGWQPLLDWTKTGDSVPYTNFNDFLHYA